jgi:hypothetical protein
MVFASKWVLHIAVTASYQGDVFLWSFCADAWLAEAPMLWQVCALSLYGVM